jgi:RNA polymerase sigma-70 factor (ECF subfamily)
MTATVPSDEDLLSRIAVGDEDAFLVLYRRRQGAVYRFALQMSGSQALAEDVVQEVFLTLIRTPRKYDPALGSVPAFLLGIARNCVLRLLERDAGYVPMENDFEPPDAGLSDPVTDLTRAQTIQRVREAVLALPPAYREALVLCDLQELSYRDAAAAAGCPEGTLRSRLHRARALLLEKLRAAGRCLA